MNKSVVKATSEALTELREKLRKQVHADENSCVEQLLARTTAPKALRDKAQRRAAEFVKVCRAKPSEHNLLDVFLQEFSLSNQEGIALMCLAEALLRIPDKDTADSLINEKIGAGDWQKHFRHSESSLVNMATVGLMLTGSFVRLEDKFTDSPSSWLPAITKKLGEPLVRQAIRSAMGIMGGQYVLGRSIEEAAKLGRESNLESTRFSFDMLGEGARTHSDANKYFDSYLQAIKSIGAMLTQSPALNAVEADGISVKLSALHPRYHYSHKAAVMSELLPQLKILASAAKGFNIGFTIDAEESERLDLSLDIFEALVQDPELTEWDGLGLVVQAYQKRAPLLIEWLVALARSQQRQFMVRLVKGAYWDREIKFAQEMGYADYPVFTRKVNTDLSYQVCAGLLLNSADVIFPQFATHNAHTIGIVWEMIDARRQADAKNILPRFEFQRLHGMGELLYDEVNASGAGRRVPLRVYAPVGTHKDLLPYLVRRLLENGANSSFVNRFLDKHTPIAELVRDSVTVAEKNQPYRHPDIATPRNIYRASQLDGGARDNSMGLDLDNPLVVDKLNATLANYQNDYFSAPIVSGAIRADGDRLEIISPTNRQTTVGSCVFSSDKDIEDALISNNAAQPAWNKIGGLERARILRQVAVLIEQNQSEFIYLIAKEAGRILPDTISEIREAVDFCRYYALQAEKHFAKATILPGPAGEQNELALHGRGTFLCISPWNFPLAIFVGQIAAALAAGNSVIAKPAEQTPLVAFVAVKLLHQAGVPTEVLALLTGEGSQIGPKLVTDARVSGVCFTGSTAVAKLISRQLSERDGAIVPLIAETGGQNCMLVDSSALPEQVVDDVIASAFNSAGQRCSALRVLYIQSDVADTMLDMLVGAMQALVIGDPMELATDVGPVIDQAALVNLVSHLDKMEDHPKAKIVARFDSSPLPSNGVFFAPTIIEIDSIKLLEQEVFGPVLHIVRYQAKDLDKVIAEINDTQYGLTLGIHSRREGFATEVFGNTKVGNTYVNRNMVGAVVGVQPFGGQGLSGTGPKAGGPHYLFRFATEKTKTTNLVATGGDVSLLNLN